VRFGGRRDLGLRCGFNLDGREGTEIEVFEGAPAVVDDLHEA
jgi:hypothetical protein